MTGCDPIPDMHRDVFVIDDANMSTVDLAADRGESRLDDLDLGDAEVPAT